MSSNQSHPSWAQTQDTASPDPSASNYDNNQHQGGAHQPYGSPQPSSLASPPPARFSQSFTQRIASNSTGGSTGSYNALSSSAQLDRSDSVVSADSRTWHPVMGTVTNPGTSEVTGLYRSPSPPSWSQAQFAGAGAGTSHSASVPGAGGSGLPDSDTRDFSQFQGDQAVSAAAYDPAYFGQYPPQQQYQRQVHFEQPQAYHTAHYFQPPAQEPTTNTYYNNANNDGSAAATAAAVPGATTTTSTRQAPPAPFNFEDSPAMSSQSAFSPRFLRGGHRRGDSNSHLLSPYTPSTATPWRSPYSPPPGYFAANDGGQFPPTSRPPPSGKKWYTWRPAWIMYVFYIFGLLCAIGHHIFYNSLNGKIADRQLEMLRYGAVLAFATKAGLVAAVIVAFRQRIWLTVQSKLLSVAALDSLFAATDDVTALWNLEVYKTATVAMSLAVFVWLAPLVIIFTSNSLSVEMVFHEVNTSCLNVRALNFERESEENWRDPTIIDDLIGQSTISWNTTGTNISAPGWFDYYGGSGSTTIDMTATLAVYTQKTVVRTGALEDICGSGWNCSYIVNFTAPGYKCEEVAKGVGASVGKLGDHDPPDAFGIDQLLPAGSLSYQVMATGGEYFRAQVDPVWPGGIPKNLTAPFPKNLGAFRTEPIIWVGYAERLDKVPTNRLVPGWDKAFIPHVFACEHYETAYKVKFTHQNGQQLTEVLDRQYLRKVVDTKWLQHEINPVPPDTNSTSSTGGNGTQPSDGTMDPTVAFPSSNYVFPQQIKRYRRVAAYHSVGKLMREFINGTLNSENILNPIAETKAVQTKLLDPREKFFPYNDTRERVQSIYEDIVFSMLAEPRFLSVVWAANPDKSSGAIPDRSDHGGLSEYPCVRSRYETRYKYWARDLWIVYSLALTMALVAVVVGTLAVLANEGVLRDTRFSNIVAATRGPALDKLGWESIVNNREAARHGAGAGGVGQADLPRDIKNVKVGYGIVPLTGDDQNTQGAGGGGGVHAHQQNSSQNSSGYASQQQQVYAEDNTRVAGRMWDVVAGSGAEVRYGFGLEGDVRQLLRNEGTFKSRPRSGIF